MEEKDQRGRARADRAVACCSFCVGPVQVNLRPVSSYKRRCPQQKTKKKLGDQERQWPCLAVFGWQLASGTARLEGDLQLVKSVRGTSLTVALDRQLQIPDTTAQPALEQGQPRHFRQP